MVKTVLLTLLVPMLALAAIPIIEHPVTDPSGMLTSGERESVSQALVKLRAERQVQMAVLLVETTEGQPIEDYAHAVFESWKGGEKGRDNGLLLVIARGDRRSRLEVGYGLEPFLTDGESTALLRAQGPLLREGRMEAALMAIIGGVRAEVAAGAVPPKVEKPGWSRRASWMFFFGLILTSLAVARGLRELLRKDRWNARGAVRAVLVGVIPPAVFIAVAENSQLRWDLILTAYLVTLGVFSLGWYLVHKEHKTLGASLLVAPSLGALLGAFAIPEALVHPEALLWVLLFFSFLMAWGVVPIVAFAVAFHQLVTSRGGRSWSSSDTSSGSSSWSHDSSSSYSSDSW
ncbi:TPM domain-containing protein [Corallococcus aberystwythensis]|uniref:TPM domain-containing protein n=1 Tax=Corallococcus aberystwythensis TaxID=2316722 RepID=A0A3A8PKB5_9BACT|nr:TPM domain-containing protein [Corallococcus aberystwythensis]RKH56816.1 TPM domain-containing protein [Corallococcus aberystwythensis]